MFYIKIRGRIHGPLEESQITQMIRQGKVGKFNEVSQDGQKWSRATDFPELFPQKVQSRASVTQPDLQLADETIGAPAVTASSQSVWFLSNDGITGVGPYSVGDIRGLLASGKASQDSFVWKEGETPQMIRNVADFQPKGSQESVVKQASAAPATKSYICSACKKTITAEVAFCPYCGQSDPQMEASGSPLLRQNRCKACQFPLEQDASFCPRCGESQGASDSSKKRLTYVLLALLFLGFFGGHNFYAGRKTVAVKQLLLGLSGLGLVITIPWAIFDSISVTTDGQGGEFTE